MCGIPLTGAAAKPAPGYPAATSGSGTETTWRDKEPIMRGKRAGTR
jgi:hypothetical protein